MYVQSIMETCGTWHSLVRKLGRCHDVRRTRHVEDKIAESKTTKMAIAPGKLQVTRQVYLWLMACMYLFAFSSLYSQIPGKLLFPTFLRLYLTTIPHGCQPVLVLGCWCLYCYLSMIAGIFNTQLCIEWGYVTACCMYIVLSCPLLAWCSIVLILPVNPEFLYQLIL